MENIAKLLKAVRESGWSVEEISGLTRIPEISLYRILSGVEDPGEAAFERIAKVIGCKVEELFSGTEE